MNVARDEPTETALAPGANQWDTFPETTAAPNPAESGVILTAPKTATAFYYSSIYLETALSIGTFPASYCGTKSCNLKRSGRAINCWVPVP